MTDDDLITFQAGDGLRLAARDIPGPSPDAPVVLCLHGLTRNSRDFAGLAERLRRHFRIIAPDQRGRGRSEYDPDPRNYNLFVQCQDTWTLLDHLGVLTCAIVGTSMGALMAVMMATARPDRIDGLVLNDAGPEVDPKGLSRIAGYVGQAAPVATWDEAAASLQATHAQAYPTYSKADWLRLARAVYVEAGDQLRPDYDPALAVSVSAGAVAPGDLWPAFEVLKTVPALVLRGEFSDILSASTGRAMSARFPNAELVTVRDRGHAPDLGEPDALEAIVNFLERGDVRTRRRVAAPPRGSAETCR